MSRGKEFDKLGPEAWATSRCSTGKRGWPTRRGAKDANRLYKRQGADLMSPYFHEECQTWHIGHLPAVVKAGIVSREEYYGREAA